MRAWVGTGCCVLALLAGCSLPEAQTPVAPAEVPASAPVEVPQPVPTQVEVPSIAAVGDLIPLGVDAQGGTAEPPVEKPELGSWYEPGVRPGAVGPAVVLGHINGLGRQGLFARLGEVREGDRIVIRREDGSEVTFSAYKKSVIDKRQFPTAEVYGNVAGPEIRLITCGGELDRVNHRYLSNIIIYGRIV